jgi:myo-inositol catabolism protein IolS
LDYVKLGRSDIKVSKFGMGVWQASSEWKGEDSDVAKAIKKSHDAGVSLMDTAEVYGHGNSEKVLGRSARKIGRDEFVIATKVFGAHLRHEELQKAFAASAARLGVKEVDLYQVHWPDPWEQIPLKETMRALEKLYLEGKIRAIGVSNFAVRDLEEARSCLSHTDVVSDQLRYNLLQRNIEEEVLPYCRREKISVLAWSPLAQGALTGKYRRGRVPKSDVRKENEIFSDKNIAQVERLVARLEPIAKKHGKTIAQVALAWLASNTSVIPIPGARNPAQAEENAGAFELSLERSELAEIESAARATKIDYFV